MGQFEVPDSLREFARFAYRNHDLAHDFDHAMKVYENAVKIVEAEGVVMTPDEVVMFPYVMIGHDIRDHKLVARCLAPSEGVVRGFYVADIGEARADVVLQIHDNCSWSKRKDAAVCPHDWMRKVLQDADWLEALGETGLVRCVEYSRSVGARVPEDVCKHIREKLLLIPAELNFESSRRAAASMDVPLLDYLRCNE